MSRTPNQALSQLPRSLGGGQRSELTRPPQVDLPLPLLYGGISQQAASSRLPNQVEDAANADFSVFDGCSKRAGTEWRHTINQAANALTSTGFYRAWPIERSLDEAYNVVMGNVGGTFRLRVFEVGGPEATVTFTGSTASYLASNSANADQLVLRTIGDTTFLVNTTVATGTTVSPTYSLSETHRNTDIMVARTPVVGTYHKADAGGVLAAGFWKYEPSGSGTFATYRGFNVTGKLWATPTGQYDDTGLQPFEFRIAFRRVALSFTNGTIAASGADWTLTKTGAFTSYTFQAGDMIRVTSGTGITPGWVRILSRDSNDQITVNTDNSSGAITVGNANTSADGIGAEFEVSANFTGVTLTDMNDVAAEFQRTLQKAGCADGLISWTKTGEASGYFTVTSPYRGADAIVYAPTSTGSGTDVTGTRQPFTNVAGFTLTAGTGGAGTSTLAIASRWVSVPASNQATYQPDATKMPVVLKRLTFVGDGTTPATFQVEPYSWTARATGDATTNKVCKIIEQGKTITDISFHAQRLVLLSDDLACFSATGEFGRFYKANFDNIVDSDPVTVQLDSDQVTSILFGVPFRKTLIVFTKAGQVFEIGSGDAAFTPGTAASTPSVNYQVLPTRPTGMDGRLYFAAGIEGTQTARGIATIYEYRYDDLAARNAADAITSHVPTLIESDIQSIVAIPEQRVLAVLNRDAGLLYVYRTFFSENVRQQQAWTKYIFPNNYRVVDITAIRNDLFVISEYPSGVFLIESIRMVPDIVTQAF